MTKFKELGQEQGVRITRPWNDEMYAHNDKVAYHQHVAIKAALARAGKNEVQLRIIAKAINAYSYGDGYSIEDIYQEAMRGLEQMPNHWLHESCWPDLLRAGIVEPISRSLVGYKN
jgi:hypothetical protein